MWFYAGAGWFIRREPNGTFRILKLSVEATEPHPAATVQADAEFEPETIVRLLAHLTGRSRPDVVAFLAGPEPPK